MDTVGKANIPTFTARPGSDKRQWLIDCDHCETTHAHGAVEGHRVAHCAVADSPYRETGYYIQAPVT